MIFPMKRAGTPLSRRNLLKSASCMGFMLYKKFVLFTLTMINGKWWCLNNDVKVTKRQNNTDIEELENGILMRNIENTMKCYVRWLRVVYLSLIRTYKKSAEILSLFYLFCVFLLHVLLLIRRFSAVLIDNIWNCWISYNSRLFLPYGQFSISAKCLKNFICKTFLT